MTNIVEATTYASIIVQLLTGIIDIRALFIPVPEDHRILKPMLFIEIVVQCIELAFYLWFVASATQVGSMAAVRYFDWVVTTPAMLFTTILFMKYKEYIELDKTDELRRINVTGFVRENIKNIVIIFLANAAMLVFGYLGERNVISKAAAVAGGFAGFSVSFYVIYRDYATKSLKGRQLYVFLFVVWSLYGLVYMLGPVPKNVGLNMLDLVAKNFFGLYLVYVITSVASDDRQKHLHK